MQTARAAMHTAGASWRPESAEGRGEADPDAGKGAIEGDRPEDEQQGNTNVPALDQEGQPADWKKICEDVIGANEDDAQG